MTTTTSPTGVIEAIGAHIRRCGGRYAEWYAGIASDPRARLFDDHNVDREHDAWIYRNAGSSTTARSLEQHFIALGCKGGSGGGDRSTHFVYAYKIKRHTRE